MSSIHPGSAAEAWDAIIIGAGPAGAATAITLSRLGRRVLLVEERAAARFKLGESLPPSAIGLVKHFLGDPEDARLRNIFFRTAGNVSLWASDTAQLGDFFFTTTGHGWCVERLAFDAALRSAAVHAGATLLSGTRFLSCTRIADDSCNWRVDLAASDTAPSSHRARYLIDCSGRRAVVAKALGVPALDTGDRLFAYARWYALMGDDEDRYTRIEAAPHGWWYSNRLPGTQDDETRRLVIMLSDSDLPEARAAARREGYDHLLGQSTHIARLLKDRGYRPCGTIRGAPADSRRLRDFCGEAWMAVGDAAQAYDPLSSQGIDKALRSASHAGHLVHYALEDCPGGAAGLGADNAHIRQYVEEQHRLWQTYIARRRYYYGLESRWVDQPFWQRRHRPSAPHDTEAAN